MMRNWRESEKPVHPAKGRFGILTAIGICLGSLAVSLVLLISFDVPKSGLLGITKGFVTKAFGNVSLDQQPIELTLKDRAGSSTLKIPKPYLSDQRHWSGGEFDFISVEVRWPTMNPMSEYWRSNPQADSKRQRIYHQDLIRVNIQRGQIPNGNKSLNRAMEKSPSDFEVTSTKLTKYLPTIRNLKWIGEDPNASKSEITGILLTPNQFHYFSDPHNSNEFIHFKCGPAMENNLPVICLGRTNLTRNLRIEYRMRGSKLARWREVDAAVRRLVQSFIQGET